MCVSRRRARCGSRRQFERTEGAPRHTTIMNDHPSLTLATFAAQLDFDSIPREVVERTVNLYVDWLGSALAGKGAWPVETIARFASQASGATQHGPCEVLIDRSRTTPYFAAMINGAASHFAEQDDVH